MAKNASFLNKLTGLKKKWDAAKAAAESQQGQFAEVPDGVYVARLTESVVHQSEKGNVGVLTKLVILSGEEKGNTVTRWDGLEREEGLPYVIRFLRSLGVEMDDVSIDDLEDALKGLTKKHPVCKIRLKTKEGEKGEFQNVYINKIVEDYEEDDSDAVEAETEDTDEEEITPPKKGKKAVAPADDDEDEDTSDEDADDSDTEEDDASDADDADEAPLLKKGMKVAFKVKGKKLTGKISSLDREDEIVMVKDDNDKIYELAFANVDPLV